MNVTEWPFSGAERAVVSRSWREAAVVSRSCRWVIRYFAAGSSRYGPHRLRAYRSDARAIGVVVGCSEPAAGSTDTPRVVASPTPTTSRFAVPELLNPAERTVGPINHSW